MGVGWRDQCHGGRIPNRSNVCDQLALTESIDRASDLAQSVRFDADSLHRGDEHLRRVGGVGRDVLACL